MIAIVSIDSKRAIGKDGQLLFSIPDDLRRFSDLTRGCCVVYGRNTLETFPKGKPHPHRDNIILSRDRNFEVVGATVVRNLEELRDNLCGCEKRVYVIGGESVYGQLLPYCNEVLITKVDARMDGADAFFPNLDSKQGWVLKHESSVQSSGGYLYRFTTYQTMHPANFFALEQ